MDERDAELRRIDVVVGLGVEQLAVPRNKVAEPHGRLQQRLLHEAGRLPALSSSLIHVLFHYLFYIIYNNLTFRYKSL